MSENILEVRNLSKDYGDFVLDKLSFSLPRGVIMGLIGENGAGKSTTINCILNETRKSGGEVSIFGKDHLLDEIEIKSKLGVVFDENHLPDLFTPMEIGTFMAGIYPEWEWSEYRQFLDKFDLPNELLSMIAGEKILPGETLIIFDEIQECPEALNSLKYFKEKANEYHVIAAGSLLSTLLAIISLDFC